jgi:phenylalanine-4-hydroxylase
VARRPFVMDEVVTTAYDFSRMQDTLFVVPSFAFLRREVEALLRSRRYLEAGGAPPPDPA